MTRESSILSVPFTLEVPAVVYPAPSAGAQPLLVVLHGQGMRPESFARRYRGLLELDCHVVFARGIYPLEIGGTAGPTPRKIGYGWYTYDGDQERFAGELERGTAHLARLLDALADALPVDQLRVGLLGFSQGAYLGYVAALRLSARLAAYVGCAARLKHEAVARELAAPAKRFPILHVHGRQDEGVAFASGESSVAVLHENGWNATLHAYEGGHMLGAAEVEVIRGWLAQNLLG